MESNIKHKASDYKEQDSYQDADPNIPSNPATIRLNKKRKVPDPSEFVEIDPSTNIDSQYLTPPKKTKGEDEISINSSGGFSTSKIPMPKSPEGDISEGELLDENENSIEDIALMSPPMTRRVDRKKKEESDKLTESQKYARKTLDGLDPDQKKEITDEYGELVRGAFPGAKADGDIVNDLKWHKWKYQVDRMEKMTTEERDFAISNISRNGPLGLSKEI